MRSPTHRALAERARAILSASPSEPHRLVDLARALDTSPFHLARVFRAETGLSPHQYLMRIRLIAALERLSAGEESLSILALDLGFSHHSHFTAAFRRTFGVTPSEVRRRRAAVGHAPSRSGAA